MNLPHDTIVLVADGARMLILRNKGDAIDPNFEVMEHRECESLPNHELQSDAPGVGTAAQYRGTTAFAKADPHAAEERRFLKSAAEALAKVAESESGGIIVAATPVALGQLREVYSERTREKLITELDKDFTRMPVDEIIRQLAAH